MPDIILKGRDTRGNLVDNVYEGVNIISVKHSNGKDVPFYAAPFTGVNFYIMKSVEGDDGKYYMSPVDYLGELSGTKGFYAFVMEEDFEKYKQVYASTSGFDPLYALYICGVKGVLEIGGLYNILDLIYDPDLA